MQAFIEALCETSAGQILAVNVLDDLMAESGRVDPKTVRDVFLLAQANWSPAHQDAYTATLGAIIQKKPDSFFRRLPRPNVAGRTFLTILTAARVCDEGHDGLLSSESLESAGLLGLRTGANGAVAPTHYYDRLARLIETREGLREGAALGKQFDIFWATLDDNAWETLEIECLQLGHCVASRKRDYLGLGTVRKNSSLIEFRFNLPSTAVQVCAPTFLEALGNTRWLSQAARNCTEFGVTADLKKVRAGDSNFDGAAEVISPCLSLADCLQSCRFAETTSEDTNCTDEQFLVAILRGRTIELVIANLASRLS
ncbi:hypothetical protein [Tahibacter sp.]|uniref:hypothetical protein n=1 Tax=Tahibacter sp. TaxID=2056211 RepID=UPI0028C49D5B|nr:hypothetical protein [Tahibacter sp.]